MQVPGVMDGITFAYVPRPQPVWGTTDHCEGRTVSGPHPPGE